MKDEKILAEERLNDEELEEVVGGSANELSRDTIFLKAVGLFDVSYEPEQLKGEKLDNVVGMMNGVLAKYDLKVEVDEKGGNRYLMYGEEFRSQGEFYRQVCYGLRKLDFDYTKYL